MPVFDIESWEIVPSSSAHEVSTWGRVKTVGGKFLKPYSAEYLQLTVLINKKKTSVKVHRWVAEAFIPNPLNLPQVNHINGDKYDNCVNNLEWCDATSNVRHSYRLGLASNQAERHPRAKFSNKQIQEVRQLRKDGASLKTLSKKFGVHYSTISKITTGVHYASV